MKAFVQTCYGGPEVLRLAEIPIPSLADNDLLIRVYANSANPADWHVIRGQPFVARFSYGLIRPRQKVPGIDFAGVVEAVGNRVTRFKVGDRVFGQSFKGGAFAEYLAVPEQCCASMPEQTNFATMACLPTAGLTALQGLVTYGKLKEKEQVLINGASGGVGHFAVQLARSAGAVVTAVCSNRNAGFVRKCGAHHVIPYDQENIHQHAGQYDLVLDINGNLYYNDYKRMAKRGVMIGFTSMAHMAGVLFQKSIGRFPLIQFTAQANAADLKLLSSLVDQQKITPFIEKRYSFNDIPHAIDYIEAMRTRGKVVMLHADQP